MTAQSRDTQILEKIQGYCNDIMFTHTEYAHDYHTFCTNPTYRNAIALCLMQIGELVKHLSPEFISLHTSIPWRAIRGMRNVVAHEYGKIDLGKGPGPAKKACDRTPSVQPCPGCERGHGRHGPAFRGRCGALAGHRVFARRGL